MALALEYAASLSECRERAGRVKILIADDHPGFRRLVSALLNAAGAECAECEDGSEAVARYPEVRPDLVLMDIAMRRVDGLRATAQIKARFPEARVFILTQYDDAELRQAALSAGAERYVLKENLSQLQALIHATALAFGSP